MKCHVDGLNLKSLTELIFFRKDLVYSISFCHSRFTVLNVLLTVRRNISV
jgi:hypothetical protein